MNGGESVASGSRSGADWAAEVDNGIGLSRAMERIVSAPTMPLMEISFGRRQAMSGQ
jgi:hypothetical protein